MVDSISKDTVRVGLQTLIVLNDKLGVETTKVFIQSFLIPVLEEVEREKGAASGIGNPSEALAQFRRIMGEGDKKGLDALTAEWMITDYSAVCWAAVRQAYGV